MLIFFMVLVNNNNPVAYKFPITADIAFGLFVTLQIEGHVLHCIVGYSIPCTDLLLTVVYSTFCEIYWIIQLVHAFRKCAYCILMKIVEDNLSNNVYVLIFWTLFKNSHKNGIPMQTAISLHRCNVRGEDRRILGLELDKDHHALFVAFSSCVIRVPLSRCSDYGICKKWVT